MIPRLPFGRTGRTSPRLLFGGFALAGASQPEADRALRRLLAHGVDHVDVAAAYGEGEAERRVGGWPREERARLFLATKTGERGYAGAREEIRRSLERMRVERVDLLQLHNLVRPEEWERALGPEGALRAAVEARDEGLVRFLGVTGHGTRVAAMHLASLERFPFDSLLLPYNVGMMAQPAYAADFARLLATARERGAAVQTIKAVARRRWPEGARPRYGTWYEPLEEPAAIERAIHFALACPGTFVISPGDLALLEPVLRAAASFREEAAPTEAGMREEAEQRGIEPLFLPGRRGAHRRGRSPCRSRSTD